MRQFGEAGLDYRQTQPEMAAAILAVLSEMLADDYPQVRVAAIQALEQLQPSGEWRAKLKYECYVPTGPFLMGSGDADNEYPAHKVTLVAFYIGKYPVTNLEFARFQGGSYQIPKGKEKHPVVSVTWDDAVAYARWAGMRLPSEAEWEKAASWQLPHTPLFPVLARAARSAIGRKRRYPWGDIFDLQRCNTEESGVKDTTPVGRYSPAGDSPYGCADMAGNVWEWTASLDKPYPYRAEDGREVPGGRDRRVLRGSSFDDPRWSSRCACRFRYTSYVGIWFFGFRVACSPL